MSNSENPFQNGPATAIDRLVCFRLLASLAVLLLLQICALELGLAESRPPDKDPVLMSQTFKVEKQMDVGLEIEARAPGASWSRRGAEAAALLVEVDGVYNQDLLLWAGDKPFVYRLMLGKLGRGKHNVTLKLNLDRSAATVRSAEVLSVRPVFPDSQFSDADRLALAYSPVIYQRANTIDRFSDIPLLMYYEILKSSGRELRVRYTAIFTNEDGGTPTAALMARWGRASDIEWVYEFHARDGKIVEETYQGVDHKTKRFNGTRMAGTHPLLADASDNNNFSDLACSAVRFALLPIRVDLATSTRESIIDSHPWIHRVMAEELIREGRIKPVPGDINSISDPRNYLYVDVYSVQNATDISVILKHNGNAVVSSSDNGEPNLRIDRSGYFRTALRLPVTEATEKTLSLVVRCHAGRVPGGERSCKETEVKRVLVLDQDYVPRELQFRRVDPHDMRPGDAIEYPLCCIRIKNRIRPLYSGKLFARLT